MTVSMAGWSGVRKIRHNGEHGRLEGSEEGREYGTLAGCGDYQISTVGWNGEKGVSGITVRPAGWKGVRQVRHNINHGGLEVSEEVTAYRSAGPVGGEWEGAGIMFSTAGGTGVRIFRHNGQRVRLERSKEGPALRSA